MNNESLYYCKRLRTLNALISKGFTDYEVIPDPTSKKGYNWFVFKRTPELDAAVAEYFAQFK
jgi:uncharacterized protein YdaT